MSDSTQESSEGGGEKQGWLSRLTGGLKRTSSSLGAAIADLAKGPMSGAKLDMIEEALIRADLGYDLARRVTTVISQGRYSQGITAEEIKEVVGAEVAKILKPVAKPLLIEGARPFVILVVGVNGSGKTTTIGKLVSKFSAEGRKVVLAAGDTFRAAAIDQLKIWGDRTGVPVIAHEQGADPGAVVFDAMQAAHARNVDVLIVDTAGRLHNKFNLMEELRKLRRIMQRHVEEAPQEVLLVIDATTGQNGLIQAKKFAESVEITDIMIAKLDGTAKGGIAFSVAKELGTPISYIGTGEKATDLAEFKPETYVDSLFFGEGDGF